MCNTSQFRFANDYQNASRDLRLLVDQAVSLYHSRKILLGVITLYGVDSNGGEFSVNVELHPDTFSVEAFAETVKTFQNVELCILLVRAENVYPPADAIKLLAAAHPKCEVIRVSTANLSFEFRQFDRLLELTEAQAHRCGCCAHQATCTTAAIHIVPIAEVRAAT